MGRRSAGQWSLWQVGLAGIGSRLIGLLAIRGSRYEGGLFLLSCDREQPVRC